MPPPPPQPPANRFSDAGTFIAAMMLLACVLGFFVLMLIVMPINIGIVLILPLVFGPLTFVQYLIWGRWLARLQAEEKAREAAEKAAAKDR